VQVNSIRYTLLFATAVCLVCSMLVASATVLLRDRQHANQLLYLQKNVLQATGLLKPGEQMSDREVVALFERSIRIRLVDLQTGDYVESPSVDPSRYDQRRARADPAQSREAPPNLSQIKRLPNLATVALVVKDGKPVQVVLPIEGIGLYGTLYGFVALDRDQRAGRLLGLRPAAVEAPRQALEAEADVTQGGAPAAAEGIAAAIEDGAEGVDERPRRHRRGGDPHPGLDGARLGGLQHGAGAQRSDPKTGDPGRFPEGRGPQGDDIRIVDYVRCVQRALGKMKFPSTGAPTVVTLPVSLG